MNDPVVRGLLEGLTSLYQALIAHLQRDLDLPVAGPGPTVTPLGTPPVQYLLRASLPHASQACLLANRAAIAVALAAASGLAFGVDRPYWAMLSAAIVLHMGTSRQALTVRAAHRVVGTLLGLGLYFVVQGLEPSEWVRLATVVFSLYASELVITRAYAYGVVFITLYALLTLPVRTESALTTVIHDRLVETLIGVACALLVTAVLGRHAERAVMEHQYHTTMDALRAELRQLATPATGGGAARRRNLVFELGRSGALLLELRAEQTPEGRPWLAVHRALADLGFDVIAVAHAPGALSPDAAGHLSSHLDAVLADDPPADVLAPGLRTVQQELLSRARHTGRVARPEPARQHPTAPE